MNRWLLVIALIALVAAGVYFGSGLPGMLSGTGGRDGGGGPPVYGPVDLPPDYETTLVLWDYLWPGPEGASDASRFETTAIPEPLGYRAHLSEALAEFSRRYPNIDVEVNFLSFHHGGGETDQAFGQGRAPDVLAVWWGGPLSDSAPAVPITPFVTETDISAFHPLGWDLARRTRLGGAGDDLWFWPRWMALHYWLINPDYGTGSIAEDPFPLESGWTAGDAARWFNGRRGDGSGDRSATPFMPFPDSTAIIGELMAAEAEPARDGSLGRALEGLRSSVDWGDPPRGGASPSSPWARDPVARLAEGRFGAAGGLGPALSAWPFLPPPGAPEDWSPKPYLMVPPPAAGDDPAPGALPVASGGGYAVLRSAPEPSPEHVQAAVHLARFLAYRTAPFAVGRMTAVPANLSALSAWRRTTSLPGAVAEQLVADAGGAATTGYRIFPAPFIPPPGTPEHDGLAVSLGTFWRGESPADDVVRTLFPGVREEEDGPDPVR